MAWVRTLLSTFVAAGAAARLAAFDGVLSIEVIAAVAGGASLLSATLWWRRGRRTTGDDDFGPPVGRTASMPELAAVISVCAVGVVAASLALGSLID